MGAIDFDRLDHVGIGVRSLEESAAWWREHFGFEREADFTVAATGAKGLFLRRGTMRLELFEFPGPHGPPAVRPDLVEALRGGGLHHLAMQVDDVEATLAELERRGVDIAMPLTHGPFGPFAFIADPSGVFVELFPRTDIRGPDLRAGG